MREVRRRGARKVSRKGRDDREQEGQGGGGDRKQKWKEEVVMRRGTEGDERGRKRGLMCEWNLAGREDLWELNLRWKWEGDWEWERGW